MQFISIYFCIFILITLIGYYSTSEKYRYIYILVCNVLYYFTWVGNIGCFFSIIFVTVVTYIGARIIVHIKGIPKKILMGSVIILSILPLVYFKYTVFLFENWNILSHKLGLATSKIHINIIMPIGISFFTFQALGYFIDVYRGKAKVENNFFLYASFVSFFPVITSGPIERADTLLEQLRNPKKRLCFNNIEKGIYLILYGAFIKLVIADRLAVIVNTVFADYEVYGGYILFISAIAYTFQIYCDFSSYSLTAMGVGKLLGFDIQENFNAPYFSKSIQEFWRRWHISLSSWFKDYVYIPLGGNRCSTVRKNINLFLTFLVSGLWHGANWTYVFWGCVHGIYQIVGNMTKHVRNRLYEKCQISTDCFSFNLGRMVGTFFCVTFGWIFFRAETISDAIHYIVRIFRHPDLWDIFNLKIYKLGLNELQIDILMIALVIFWIVDYVQYIKKENLEQLYIKQNWTFRGVVLIVLFISVLVFGMYGPQFNSQEFIYFQF